MTTISTTAKLPTATTASAAKTPLTAGAGTATAAASGFDPNNLPVPVGTASGSAGLTGVGIVPVGAVNPLATMLGGYGSGYGSSLGSGQAPQTNATNQTGYAPNGDVNQNVVNNNTQNIYVQSPSGGYTAYNPYLASAVSGGYFGSSLISYGTGITGWFQRLFSGL